MQWHVIHVSLEFTIVFFCSEQLMQLYCARQRRRLNRGLRRKQQSLLKRLRKAKKEAPPMEKPEVVKTHLRDMVILPEMVGSMVGVYNGKTFNQVEIKVRCQQNASGLGLRIHAQIIGLFSYSSLGSSSRTHCCR